MFSIAVLVCLCFFSGYSSFSTHRFPSNTLVWAVTGGQAPAEANYATKADVCTRPAPSRFASHPFSFAADSFAILTASLLPSCPCRRGADDDGAAAVGDTGGNARTDAHCCAGERPAAGAGLLRERRHRSLEHHLSQLPPGEPRLLERRSLELLRTSRLPEFNFQIMK